MMKISDTKSNHKKSEEYEEEFYGTRRKVSKESDQDLNISSSTRH